MGTPRLVRFWLEEFSGEKAFRADFDNDRHHWMIVEAPQTAEQVSQALLAMARNIGADPNLKKQNARGDNLGVTCATAKLQRQGDCDE